MTCPPLQAVADAALRSFPSQVVAAVPRGPGAHEFDISKVVHKASMRTQGVDFIAFALAASREALHQAGMLSSTSLDGTLRMPYAPERAGVAIGSGIGAIDETAATAVLLHGGIEAGQRKVSPFFVPRMLTNMAAGNVSIEFNLQGPCHAASTACATGAHAIGDAFRFIKYGHADMMLAGGTEAAIGAVSLAGFTRAKALSTKYNAQPEAASRPFDAGRDGFVLGEGAGVLVLEELAAARARGAVILAEVRGYGACGDAHHITAPRDDGSGAYRCMAAALEEGGVLPAEVGYVNAHATSTPVGDVIEGVGMARLFRAQSAGTHRVAVSSTKGAVGHLLGAAGAVEAAVSILALTKVSW